MKKINVTAEIDSQGWLNVHTRLPEKMEPGPLEAVIILHPTPAQHVTGATGPGAPSNPERIMDCIRELRKLGPVAGIQDPVAWQRSIREDRAL